MQPTAASFHPFTRSAVEPPTKKPRTADKGAEHPDASSLPLDIPPVAAALPRTKSLEDLLSHDVASRIMDHAAGALHPVCSHDDAPLDRAARLYASLACVSRALRGKVLVHPHHASIQWLRALNHIAARIRDPEHRASALGRLIHAHFDVRLRDWPSAPETRTAMLVERLYHHASADEFKTLLSELFKLSGGDTPDTNARMFIDPRCIASSALGTIVRPLGFASLPTFQIIDRIVEEFDSLFSPSPRHRAKFWAELTVSHREPRRRQDASNVLRKLIDEHAELSHFGEFFEQAMAFLMKPQEAPHEHREAMITYLMESGTPLSPLSVELLVALAGLVHAREGQGLSEVQRTRLQPLLSQYMQAFNALHTRLLHKAREQMRRIPVRLLLLPFSQLDMDDKLKIVDVPVDTSDEDGEDFFYLDVQTFLPMIRSALTDNALPLQMRLALARKLLDRLKETSNEKALETYELHVLHASLSGEPNAANDFGPVR